MSLTIHLRRSGYLWAMRLPYQAACGLRFPNAWRLDERRVFVECGNCLKTKEVKYVEPYDHHLNS